MSEKINSQYDTSGVSSSKNNILDFFQYKEKIKKNSFTTLELIDGTISSIVGNEINLLNEFTVAAAAQNFSSFIKKEIRSNGKIFVAHDGSLHAILFSKVFASVLISENIDTYFNYKNRPLNNSMALYISKNSKMDFEYIVTFSSNIQKNHHLISFFDKNGLLLSSKQSKKINSLISETSLLNLTIPNKKVPMIYERNLFDEYMQELKIENYLSNLDILVSNPFDVWENILLSFFDQNDIKTEFVKWKKIPNKENKVAKKSLRKTIFSKKDMIINFSTNINNFEIIVKHKKRWKFLSLNDLAILYIHYKKMLGDVDFSNKKVYYSYNSSRFINYYAKKNKIHTSDYYSLIEFIKSDDESDLFLATNGIDYLVTENNSTFCSDPIMNIKLFIEMASYFKSNGKNLYDVLTSIYTDNQIFHFNLKKEKIDMESANLFFNKIKNLKEVNDIKVARIINIEHPLGIELRLQDQTIINFEYFKNINMLVSSISVWDTSKNQEKNHENRFIDLIVKEKKIINEINSLKETFNVTKFSWQGFTKYSIFVILFILLFYLMFTFVLGGDRGLWNEVLLFLKNESLFAYSIPVIIFSCFILVFLSCCVDLLLLKKLNEKVKIRNLWVANVISICISSITPLIYGGESVGYWYLRRKGLNRSSIAAMFLIKSLFTQINFIIFATIFAPIGFVRFYQNILGGEHGVFIIICVVVGTIFDIFSAIMISLLTFSSRLTSRLAKMINKFIEWIPFIVSRNSNERGSQLKYEFTNINIATKKIFYNDVWYKNAALFMGVLLFYLAFKFFDLNGVCFLLGNFSDFNPNNWLQAYFDLLAGQTMVRSVNAMNMITPSGLGVSDWAYKNILSSLFVSTQFYKNVEVFQTLTRIIFTFSVVIISAFMLLTIFIGESRIDKYNKIRRTLSIEEIRSRNVKVKTKFYSFAFIPWFLGIVILVLGWDLLYYFFIF